MKRCTETLLSTLSIHIFDWWIVTTMFFLCILCLRTLIMLHLHSDSLDFMSCLVSFLIALMIQAYSCDDNTLVLLVLRLTVHYLSIIWCLFSSVIFLLGIQRFCVVCGLVCPISTISAYHISRNFPDFLVSSFTKPFDSGGMIRFFDILFQIQSVVSAFVPLHCQVNCLWLLSLVSLILKLL
jgi:hypothetical protein